MEIDKMLKEYIKYYSDNYEKKEKQEKRSKNMKLIAKTINDKSYMHSKKDSFFCSNRNADEICESLNRTKYKLQNDFENWRVYDYDFGQEAYCDKKIHFNKNKDKIIIERI